MSRNCICKGISVEEVHVQTSLCPILDDKVEGKVSPHRTSTCRPTPNKTKVECLALWCNLGQHEHRANKMTPGSHGKLGSLSLPISSNYSCVRLITVRSLLCSYVVIWSMMLTITHQISTVCLTRSTSDLLYVVKVLLSCSL
jgi:hypothetical protein